MTTVKKYKGLEVTIKGLTFTQDDVNAQIDQLLKQNAKQVVKEGNVENGDTTLIAFEGFKDGVPFPGGKSDAYELVIGSHMFIPGFEEAMVGMEKGETRDINLTFPENYSSKDLAGQPVVFKVTVKDIFTKEKPELTDEFVAGLNMPNLTTAAELIQYVNDMMTETCQRQNSGMAANEVFEALIANTEVELTDKELEDALEDQKRNVEMQLAQQGATIEMYAQSINKTVDEFVESLKGYAVKQCTLDKALMKIAELENLEVTDEEIEEQFTLLAAQFGQDVSMIKEKVNVEDVKKQILLDKASNIVLANSIIHVN